ncbi:glutamate-cysteine ligase family protein [Actinoplanes missouriensis]|uniref:glutamate-cysteine ligase family protein n=1 Tax=Actinoplanes missouriensis TaxID=1866 RepID=UPI0033E03EE0
MTALTEKAAADLLAAEAFSPGLPGFVGIAVDLLLDPASAPSGRRPLRHGFLDARSPRVMVVSGPPSPGLEVALRRMADDTAASTRLVEKHRLTVLDQATDTVHPDGPEHALGTATAGIRIGLEPGLDGGGPLGLGRRWNLAHTLTPVLAAAFANAPLRHGRPTGWRSVRQALRRELPVASPVAPPVASPVAPPVASPVGGARESWAAYVLQARTATGRSLRDALHAGTRITVSDLRRHRDALRPPVAARGHLELDVADRQPGSGWRLPVTVATVLMDDPRAAEEAWEATKHLVGEVGLWERAARDALTDPVLAAAARECFVAAYGALARQGAGRELRDAVAEFTERYVHRGRCPADDILDQVTAHS